MKTYRPPAFQFYAKDWLSSMKVQGMTWAEKGMYITIISYMWLDEDCGLDNDAITSLLAGYSWANSPLSRCFVVHPENPSKLTNLKLLGIRKELFEYHKKQSSNGITGMKSRWKNHKPKHNDAITLHLQSSSSSSSLKPIQDKYPSDFMEFWKAYPHRNGNATDKNKALEVWLSLSRDKQIASVNAAKAYSKNPDINGGKGEFVKMPHNFLQHNDLLELANSLTAMEAEAAKKLAIRQKMAGVPIT